jgi:hypothetical protein
MALFFPTANDGRFCAVTGKDWRWMLSHRGGGVDLLGDTFMKRALILGAFAVFAVALMFNSNVEGVGDKKDEKPKYTIKEVMKEAHKSGLFKKIQKGDADKADREKLAELYKALALSEPGKGDKEVWKKTTTAMLKIATDAIADPEAGKKLKVDCGACHKAFK